MSTMISGAIAGAVGSAALNVTTYADMALRGRSSSDTPAETVKRLAARSGISIENGNRASALGALSGYLVGIGAGAAYGLLRPRLRAVPLLPLGLALGAAAMAASDVPATRMGATQPQSWGISGWLADIVPHAIYGVITALAFDAIAGRD